jgi:single-strand DNA-binding protein
MASFNKVILAGNLTRDPELRYLPKGTAVAQFALAVNRTWKSESGEAKEEVNFIEVEAFGRQAEVIAQYMRKGRPLLVEGRLKQDSWEDKTTHQKKTKLKVVLEGFSFIDSKGQDSGAPSSAEAPRRPAAAPSAPPTAPKPPDAPEGDAAGVEEDDVPF